MRTISREQTIKKAKEYWNNKNTSVSMAFNHILMGHLISTKGMTVSETHHVFLIIIHKPKVEIENYQISLIADALGGSLTEGTIIYQGDYAIITWSNWSRI